MATAAMIPLATTTLSSNSTQINFTSIPSGYRDLIIQGFGISTSNINAFIYFNGDTTASNYYTQTAYGEATTAGGTNNNDSRIMSTGTVEYPFQIEIFDYSSDKLKVAYSRSGALDIVRHFCTRWSNTNAITSIRLEVSGDSFRTNSVFSLFGVYGEV